MSTFFTDADKFQEVPEDGKILVVPFLKAAGTIPKFFELLGTAFTPLKIDAEGNVIKLQTCHDSNPEKYQTLQDILQEEIEKETTKAIDSSTEALLWETRVLQFMVNFWNQVVEDHKSGAKTENLSAMLENAYENSLKKHHAWLVQKGFTLSFQGMPWRKDLLKTLALGQDNMEDQVIEEMAAFTGPMEQNIKSIDETYQKLGLDSVLTSSKE